MSETIELVGGRMDGELIAIEYYVPEYLVPFHKNKPICAEIRDEYMTVPKIQCYVYKRRGLTDKYDFKEVREI